MDEPKLTAPQRRYEIIADSNTVLSNLETASDEQTPVFFDIVLADIYEGKPPIPDEIARRNLGMYVLQKFCEIESKDTRFFGHTVESSAEKVNVRVPEDRTRRSTLELLDISSVSRNQES